MSTPTSQTALTGPGWEVAEPGGPGETPGLRFSTGTRWLLLVGLALLGIWFIHRIGSIIWPFIWALVAAYIIMPVVDFCNERLRIPRFVVVLGLFVLLVSILIVGFRYLAPWIRDQLTYFAQDLPKLNGSLISHVGKRPLGINVTRVEEQLADRLTGSTKGTKASIHLLAVALSAIVRVLLFLFTTVYLLLDGPRIRRNLPRLLPVRYRPEFAVVFSRINATWMNYLRGELILFVIMTVVSYIGLSILQVPGALPLAVATGILELVPLVGPYTAGALAVSVAYLSPTNPFGWSQITYGVVVALMYLGLREAEDYVVIPRVLGHAVKLHPLIILFSLTVGGVTAGVFGLLVAVPVAASLKIVGAYLYDKIVLQRPEFVAVHGVQTEP